MRFLKHLSRTHLLLHLIDIAPIDQSDPIEGALSIVAELKKHSQTLYNKERWLVLNKTDLLPEDEVDAHCEAIVEALQGKLEWQGSIYRISAVSGAGTQRLAADIMTRLENLREEAEETARREALAAEREAAERAKKNATDNVTRQEDSGNTNA